MRCGSSAIDRPGRTARCQRGAMGRDWRDDERTSLSYLTAFRVGEGKGSMDGQRFDNLTRSLARGIARRTLLKGLAGGLAGSLVVRAGSGAATGCTRLGESCSSGDQCCSGVCKGDARGRGRCDSCPDRACPKYQYLDPRDCQCRCKYDRQVCAANEVCTHQGCAPGCNDSEKMCGDRCIDAGACCTDTDCVQLDDQCRRGACREGVCQAVATAEGQPCDDGGTCLDGQCHLICQGTECPQGALGCCTNGGACEGGCCAASDPTSGPHSLYDDTCCAGPAIGACTTGSNCFGGCCYEELIGPDNDICCTENDGYCTSGADCHSGCCYGQLIESVCCSPGAVGLCASGPSCQQDGCCRGQLVGSVCCNASDADGLCASGDLCSVEGCCSGKLYGDVCCNTGAVGVCTSGTGCSSGGCCYGSFVLDGICHSA